MAGLMVAASACNLSNNTADEPGNGDAVESAEFADKDAQLYRMYYDSSADASENEFQMRYFTGQLRLADIEGLYGDIDDLPQDSSGNYIGDLIQVDGLVWSLVASPSQAGVNLVSRDSDGTISSAFDLDGDRVADIVDIRLGDGRRFTFVTEGLGMGVFEQWLKGNNPLCNNSLNEDLGLDFECGNDDAGGSGDELSAGGAVSASLGGGYVDPIALICAAFQTNGRYDPSVMSRGFLTGFSETRFSPNGSYFTSFTSIITDADGNHALTTRITYYYDTRNVLTRLTVEAVDSDGNGTRTITDYDYSHNQTTREERFRASLDDQGRYKSYQTSPPAENPNSSAPPEEDSSEDPRADPPEEPAPDAPDDTNPGPDGDDTAIREFCEQRESHVNGVQEAADTDPTAFQISCNDLTGAPSSGGDCTILDWAGPGDFKGALEPSDDDGCDDFEQPDAEGNCEPSNVQEILRGRTALLMSANLQGVELCPPIVCNPELFDEEPVSPLSGELPTDPTDTPTPASSPNGVIPEIALCYTGPGPSYDTVSSLKAGLSVDILGVGAEGGWLIVDNPNFRGVSCWVAEEDVETPPNLDLSRLPEYLTPALPAETPETDSGGGGTATKPAAPSSPVATVTCDSNNSIFNITLTWKDNSANESGFRIYRGGQLIATVGAGITQYMDINLPNNNNGYNYTVSSYNGAGESTTVGVLSDGCVI